MGFINDRDALWGTRQGGSVLHDSGRRAKTECPQASSRVSSADADAPGEIGGPRELTAHRRSFGWEGVLIQGLKQAQCARAMAGSW
jgi:hypothetical protein